MTDAAANPLLSGSGLDGVGKLTSAESSGNRSRVWTRLERVRVPMCDFSGGVTTGTIFIQRFCNFSWIRTMEGQV